jgi:Flp pilus assembly secretin CpaC
VSKGNQQITFLKPADRTFVKNAKFVLAATVNSGLPVTFASSNPNILSISGNTATVLAKGKVTITASQKGNGKYNQAASIVREIIFK